MIKRLIYNRLSDIITNSSKAILLTGARQVGKTYIIRELGEKMFDNFIEINFIENSEIANYFKKPKSVDEILLRLSTLYGKQMVKGKTLIFFDEIQVCPDLVTSIKFLVDEGSYRYAMSGSLLGVELNDLRSQPVGYIDVIDMHPLDLKEFVQALGVGDDVINHLYKCFSENSPVDEFVHNRMMQLVRLYLLVGGMPAVVAKYLESNNLRLVTDEQQAILRLYKKDIAQYDPQRKLYLNEIFDLIPPELNEKNKRFILKSLNENMKFNRYENSFLWLKDAGVAIPTYNVEEPTLPLLLSRSRNLFKLFQNDVGLLAAQYASNIQLKILNGEDQINYGSIYENFVAQELTCHGFPTYYFNSKKHGELDFVIEHNDAVLPIEVKSGKEYLRHRALVNIMDVRNYGLTSAIVLCNDNISVVDSITYYPIYMTMFINRKEPSDLIVDIGN
ncbi:MAG: ATP-binding protein [Bacteroidaceae bacterium]|nr:ATP-binding protein [Bacteroidaceae bacterium]